MSDPTRSLHREVARVRQSGTGRGHRYPAALRAEVVVHVRERRARGESLAAISRDLDLNPFTLQRWLDAGRPPSFRPVEVAPAPATTPPAAGLVVTMPSGVRVEGLDLPNLLALIRALA